MIDPPAALWTAVDRLLMLATVVVQPLPIGAVTTGV